MLYYFIQEYKLLILSYGIYNKRPRSVDPYKRFKPPLITCYTGRPIFSTKYAVRNSKKGQSVSTRQRFPTGKYLTYRYCGIVLSVHYFYIIVF